MVMISFGVYYWDSWVCVYVSGFFCYVGWFYLFVFTTCEDLVAFCPMLSWHFIELPITAKVHSWWIMIQRSSIDNFTHRYKLIFHLLFYFFIRHCLDVLQFIAITFCTICADFVTSLFTLFSKSFMNILNSINSTMSPSEVPDHSFPLNWLPSLAVSFFSFNGVVTHMMNFLLPCGLVSLKLFEDLVECHLEMHVDYINCVTIRTGSLLPECLFTSSKEL